MSNVLRLFCMTVEFAEGMAKFSADFQEAACYCVKCKWLLLRLRIPILSLKMTNKEALQSTWSDTKYYTEIFKRKKLQL